MHALKNQGKITSQEVNCRQPTSSEGSLETQVISFQSILEME
jgi:hypothetical protein